MGFGGPRKISMSYMLLMTMFMVLMMLGLAAEGCNGRVLCRLQVSGKATACDDSRYASYPAPKPMKSNHQEYYPPPIGSRSPDSPVPTGPAN